MRAGAAKATAVEMQVIGGQEQHCLQEFYLLDRQHRTFIGGNWVGVNEEARLGDQDLIQICLKSLQSLELVSQTSR